MKETISTDSPSGVFGIGQLAESAGCGVETVRFYERAGLLPEPPRSAGGHRNYRSEHLRRLRFIRRGRALGFSLDEIRELLALADGGGKNCADVRQIASAHLDKVREKLAELRRLEASLDSLAGRCGTGKTVGCPIIEDLSDSG
ncbi:MAG: helix-turn-helix domain-containing protein [Gammaproteobacteria bacterium]|nr:helix-turn-helix domain-containing protein [Gammaproteobacteria bacterium]